MKIRDIETIFVGAPTPGCGLLSNRNYVYLLVHTDEGISGIGEATLESHDESLLGVLRDLSDLVIGQDASDINRLTQHLFKQRFWKGGVGTEYCSNFLLCWEWRKI